MIESRLDEQNNKRIFVFILMVLLWAFGPSVFAITDINFTVASFVWILQYGNLWPVFYFRLIPPTSFGFILHLPRFFFLLYVTSSFRKAINLKKTFFIGILAELPFMLVAVYYMLFPPGVYSYYFTIPVPIILVIGVLLLILKPQIRA